MQVRRSCAGQLRSTAQCGVDAAHHLYRVVADGLVGGVTQRGQPVRQLRQHENSASFSFQLEATQLLLHVEQGQDLLQGQLPLLLVSSNYVKEQHPGSWPELQRQHFVHLLAVFSQAASFSELETRAVGFLGLCVGAWLARQARQQQLLRGNLALAEPLADLPPYSFEFLSLCLGQPLEEALHTQLCLRLSSALVALLAFGRRV